MSVKDVGHSTPRATSNGSPHFHGPGSQPIQDDSAGLRHRGDAADGLGEMLPWWRRPSPTWLLVMIPLSAVVASAAFAPRIEIYLSLACKVHRPDYFVTDGAYPFRVERENLDLRSLPKIKEGGSEGDLNLCASDPVVQASVAKLTLVTAAAVGILSCFTTAWWGSYSDRHGRTRVLAISMTAFLIDDINFILTAHFYQYLPGGYWFFIVGPIIEGFLGGRATMTSAMHAYVADCTDSESRSRIFSLYLGLLYTGMFLGPTLGSLFIRFTQHTLSVFYIAAGLHVIYMLAMWLIVPESLSLPEMDASHVKWQEEVQARNSIQVGTWRKLFGFMSPLSVLLPKRGHGNSHKLGSAWGLLIVVIAYGFTISLMGSFSYKLQYVSARFGWTSEATGYWLSLMGGARAAYLTIILPAAIKYLKPKARTTYSRAEPLEEAQPLVGPSSATSDSPPVHNHRSAAFDLGLARVSLSFHFVAYVSVALVATPMAFALLSLLSAFGEGFSPALHSLALEMYVHQGGTESGRLFGAISVVQALCAQIVGPAVFGLTYLKTVATFPQAIFFLSAAAVAVSFILLSIVRLPGKTVPGSVAADDEAEESGDLIVVT